MATTHAFFGGTFDPPHIGHVLAAHYALITHDIERLLVIPCARHPFGKNQAPFERRLAMCRLAFEELGERVQVLDIEARRPGTSFTIDTARELQRIFPDVRFSMIVGSDIPDEIPKWKDSEALLQLVDMLVLPRTGSQDSDPDAFQCLPEVSSTDIRRRLAQEQDAAPFLPRTVLQYIRDNELYKT